MDRILQMAVVCVLVAVGGHLAMTMFVQQHTNPDTSIPREDNQGKEFKGIASHSDGAKNPRPAQQITLKAGRHGHFYLNARINGGKRVMFLVDSGASFVALSQKAALAAGFHLPASAYKHKISTANGQIFAASVMLKEVQYKSLKVRNVRAMVMPKGALSGVSLLGNSFLSRLSEYSVRGNKLVMRP